MLSKEVYDIYTTLLKTELIEATGCTEPIALALAAAKARQVLGEMPEEVEVYCSGNIVKNVKAVVVPNSGGLKGRYTFQEISTGKQTQKRNDDRIKERSMIE